jgi:putative colanic acid biosynthesis acetyltransferase WcaF
MMVDVRSNRREQKWTRSQQIGRMLWTLVHPVFRFSPRPMWGIRRVILRMFGAQVSRGAHVYPTVKIAIPWNIRLGQDCAVGDCAILYSLGVISIGDRCTISQGAHLCAGTHDIADPARLLLKPPISVGNDAWVCADAFIGPGVNIGNGAIVGARAVVMRDVQASVIMVGNPAQQIRSIKE